MAWHVMKIELKQNCTKSNRVILHTRDINYKGYTIYIIYLDKYFVTTKSWKETRSNIISTGKQ